MAWLTQTLRGLYHSGYTSTQLSKPALLAEPSPPVGSLLRADVAITTPLAGWELPANSYVSLDLLKLAGAELARRWRPKGGRSSSSRAPFLRCEAPWTPVPLLPRAFSVLDVLIFCAGEA
jgi:hypothetical protein